MLIFLILLLLFGLEAPLLAQTAIETQEETSSLLLLKSIKFEGNRVFSNNQLTEQVNSYLGKQYTPEELYLTAQKIQQEISQFYRTQGYIFSGAYLGEGKIFEAAKQELIIQIKEQGTLEKIEIFGLQRLPSDYVRSRIEAFVGVPLNIQDISLALSRLQADPHIAQIQGNLKRHNNEQIILEVTVIESPSFEVTLEGNNYESVFVGSNQLISKLDSTNLLGFGDTATLQYNGTEGLDKGYFNYTFPLNGLEGNLSFQAEIGDSKIIEAPLDRFNITSNIQKYQFSWERPLHVDFNNEVSLFAGLMWQQNRSYLLDIPFSFIPEVPNPETTIAPLFLGFSWRNKSEDQLFLLRSEFHFGLDWLNATALNNPSGLDGRYFLWRSQLQYAKFLANNLLFIGQFSSQLTPDALLPAERLQVGGYYTVPGYDNNARTGDNGYFGRVELRYTPIRDKDWGNITVNPYFAYGFVSNNKFKPLYPDTLSSLGIGLFWERDPFYLRLDYAEPLTSGLPEQNILFQLGVKAKW